MSETKNPRTAVEAIAMSARAGGKSTQLKTHDAREIVRQFAALERDHKIYLSRRSDWASEVTTPTAVEFIGTIEAGHILGAMHFVVFVVQDKAPPVDDIREKLEQAERDRAYLLEIIDNVALCIPEAGGESIQAIRKRAGGA